MGGSQQLRGGLAATGAFVAVGSLVAASDVIDGYPFPAGQTVRYLIASAFFLLLAGRRLTWPTGREALWLIGLAATGLVLFNAFVVGGVREGDPATVGVIIGCVPVVLAIAGPLLAGRRPLLGVVGAAVLVAAGAAIVQYAGGELSGLGLLFALGALACEAAFSLLAVPVLGPPRAAERVDLRLPVRGADARALGADRRRPLAAYAVHRRGARVRLPRAGRDLRRLPALVHRARPARRRTGGAVLRRAADQRAGLLGRDRRGARSRLGRLVGVAVVAAGVTLGMRLAPSPVPAEAAS